jgi:hypothetical protein
VAYLIIQHFSAVYYEEHFKKKLMNAKSVPRFSLRLLSETFLILRIIQRDIITLVFMPKTQHSYQILVKLEFSREVFKKSSNIKFLENPSSGGPHVALRRKTEDGHTWRC